MSKSWIVALVRFGKAAAADKQTTERERERERREKELEIDAFPIQAFLGTRSWGPTPHTTETQFLVFYKFSVLQSSGNNNCETIFFQTSFLFLLCRVCVCVCMWFFFFFFFGFWSSMSFLFSSIFFISLAPNAQAIYFDLLSSSSVIISIINTVILFFSHSSWHLFLCIVFLLL